MVFIAIPTGEKKMGQEKKREKAIFHSQPPSFILYERNSQEEGLTLGEIYDHEMKREGRLPQKWSLMNWKINIRDSNEEEYQKWKSNWKTT